MGRSGRHLDTSRRMGFIRSRNCSADPRSRLRGGFVCRDKIQDRVSLTELQSHHGLRCHPVRRGARFRSPSLRATIHYAPQLRRRLDRHPLVLQFPRNDALNRSQLQLQNCPIEASRFSRLRLRVDDVTRRRNGVAVSRTWRNQFLQRRDRSTPARTRTFGVDTPRWRFANAAAERQRSTPSTAR